MASKEKKGKLTWKYKLSLYNYRTLREVYSQDISRLTVLTIIGAGSLVIIVLFLLLLIFTPLKEYIPGYPTVSDKRLMVMNKIRVDSLVQEIKKRDEYLDNLKTIISGNTPKARYIEHDTSETQDKPNLQSTVRDSLFKQQVENEENLSLSINKTGNMLNIPQSTEGSIYRVHFYPPVKGIVTNKFSPESSHYGADIVSNDNEVISATLDGIITMSSWTLSTGYVVQIQHKNNLISVYKHVSSVLKEVGEKVKAGEAIAIYGNSGEITTGPHLHFELWYNGKALNPENYIVF